MSVYNGQAQELAQPPQDYCARSDRFSTALGASSGWQVPRRHSNGQCVYNMLM